MALVGNGVAAPEKVGQIRLFRREVGVNRVNLRVEGHPEPVEIVAKIAPSGIASIQLAVRYEDGTNGVLQWPRLDVQDECINTFRMDLTKEPLKVRREIDDEPLSSLGSGPTTREPGRGHACERGELPR